MPRTEVFDWAIHTYGSRLAITTSFQCEGMVVVDMAARLSSRDIRVLTLDTGPPAGRDLRDDRDGAGALRHARWKASLPTPPKWRR